MRTAQLGSVSPRTGVREEMMAVVSPLFGVACHATVKTSKMHVPTLIFVCKSVQTDLNPSDTHRATHLSKLVAVLQSHYHRIQDT